MGTQTLTLAVCWLAVTGFKVYAEKAGSNSGLIDNVSAESVSRLYRNVPVGVYASNTPYGAYSFHVPSFIAPKTTSGKEDSVLSANTNSFLKDSYGNQFQSPQAFSYKNSFPQQFVQLQNLPAHLSQPLVSPNLQFKQSTPHFFSGQYNVPNIQSVSPNSRYQQPLGFSNIQSFAPNPVVFAKLQPQTAQQLTSNTKNIYANALASEPKFQRLQEMPHISFVSNEKLNGNQQTAQSGQLQQVQQPQTQTTITTLPNGQKIAVNLVTKPPIPLLDLSLLEPLTFANPLVPQVQHFLPRINQATYHKLPNVNVVQNKQNKKEFVVTNTKSYNSGNKPKSSSSKKKHKKIVPKHQPDDEKETLNPTITTKDTSNENPEISYEINSPNYKETYTEKKVSYNKETESEPKTYNYEMKTDNKPVHYSYQKNSQDEPVHVSYETHTGKAPVHYTYEEQTQKEPIRYSYVKTSKEPTTHYQNENQNPEHLIYTVKANEQDFIEEEEQRPRHHPRENAEDTSDESYEDNAKNEEIETLNQNQNHGRNVNSDESSKNIHHKPEHREVQYYRTHQENPKIVQHHNTPQSFGHAPKKVAPIQHEQQHFQPIVPEYEEDIIILPQHKPHEAIRVDPNQHVQNNQNPLPRQQNHQTYYDYPESHYSSAPIIKGKPKQEHSDEEESAENTNNENNARILANMFKDQEKNEENFEKSYKDAAYGFAAYDAPRVDTEKEIYNPESYGAPRYYAQYNVVKTPLEQYEAEGDGFPKFSRLTYKDTRDKMQEDYYLDYAVSKPKSLQDRYQNKEGYYTLYKNQKPESVEHEDDDENNKSAKYTSYEYTVPEQKQKHHAKPKANSESYEYDYSNDKPRDAAAHATRPHHRYKSKTQFVEPQFQYGFEPISIPQLLDSELSAMASNNNPKSEQHGTRKKIFKENLVIKKMSTKGAKKSS